jgi:Holliday junction DNA helicase RuvA
VLELKDRVGPAVPPARLPGSAGPPVPAAPPWAEQVGTALVGLGYSAREAEEAVAAIAPQFDGDRDGGSPDVAAVLRRALSALSRP